MLTHEEMAKILQDTTEYKVLRRLYTTPRKLSDFNGPTRRALLVDVETTGLDPLGTRGTPDEIIEFAALPIAYSFDGMITEVFKPLCALREPSRPIPPEITKLTGISDEMVRGRNLDMDQIEHLVKEADLVIAHNARFDRVFCEALHPAFENVRWGCAQTQVPWNANGFEGTKLSYLLSAYGLFYDRHRAEADVFALAEILARPLGATGRPALGILIEEAYQRAVRVYASGAPYDKKDLLRSRGYRWSAGESNSPRAWYRDVAEPDLGVELEFLCESILPPGGQPLLRRIDAFDRFSARV